MSASTSERQICSLYQSGDFMVVSGINAGEPVAGAGESALGDIYMFSPGATPRELPLAELGFGGGESGRSGSGLVPESRLTFVGGDGATVEVLIIDDARARAAGTPALHLLPIAPLVPGVEYTLVRAEAEPGRFSYGEYAGLCLARGTMIRMADGRARAVEALEEGDLVLTRDSGPQPVRWAGGRTVRAHGHLAPVVITKGALNNTDDLIVSQQHRMLLSDWRAEVMLGSHEVLVRARDLVNGETIHLRPGGMVEYFHILLDSHEIIYAEDIPSESLHMDSASLAGMEAGNRAEIVELFPEIESCEQVPAVSSRMSLKSCQAEALLKQVGFR